MENRSLDNIIKSSLEDFKVDCTPQDWAFMENMLNAEESVPIDEAAKSKLQNMEVPLDAAAWLTMEGALDNLELEGIDELAKSALEDFETPYNPSDWDLMEQKIDADLPHSIDDLAKTALGDLTVPFVPFHWTIMDNRLDDEGFPNETDEAVKAALQQYESAQPSNWAAMETSLVEAENVRRQLIITKSIEVFLFIFAIWTIGNFLPFNHNSTDNKENTPKANIENTENATILPQANLDKTSNLVEDNTTLLDIPTRVDENNLENIEKRNIANSNHQKIEIPKPQDNINKVTTNSSALFENPIKQLIEEVTNNTLLKELSAPMEQNSKGNKIEEQNPLAVNESEFVTYGEDKKGRGYEKKENLLAALMTKSINEVKFTKAPLNKPMLQTPKIHLKASVNPQYARFIEEKGTQIASGFATNLGIDYALSDKIEVSAGFTYNQKNYSYHTIEPFANTHEPQLVNVTRDVKLDILQIPLRLNYNFKKNKKTRLYAIVGLTPGIIMKKDNNSASNTLLFNDLTQSSYDSFLRSSVESEVEEENFDNSDISARSFLTGDLGLGLEYKAHSRVSFFIEPLIQHSIGGIGTDDESYQNYSLALGSRIAL